MKKTLKLVKKIKLNHRTDYSYNGLVKWYHSMFTHLGWMILAKEYDMNDKIISYKTSLGRLKEGLIYKHMEMEDHDKKRDLEIMLRNLELLIKHTNKDF